VTVAGVAWDGVRGIERVEVRVDGGPFEAARLGARFADAAWRQWVYDWRAEPGEHLVSVRATDGQAAVQEPRHTSPLPDGATGHHLIWVTVT
jgi:hypothetical protein